MPPLILSPSFNSTGSVSAPPNLTISGIMSAASGVFSGNVGIGTGSPNLQLTLTGSLLLFNNSSGIHQNIYYNSGWKYSTNGYGWAISDIGSGSLAFQMAPNNTAGAGATATVSQPVVITNSGNVGIGTTSPNAGLDVRSNVAFNETSSYSQTGGQAYRAVGRPTDDYSWAPLVFPYTPRGITLPGNYLGGMSYLPASITLYGNDKGDNSASVIDPTSGLVNGTNYTITTVGNTNWNDIGLLYGTPQVGMIFTYNNVAVTPATGNTGRCKLAPNLAQRITILNPSGNVGIGTSNPSFPLDVQYSVAGNSVAQIYNGTANAASQALFLAKTSGSAGVQIGQTYGASGGSALLNNLDNGALWFGTNNTERMRITSSGNVGIGTSNPTSASLVVSRTSDGYMQDIGSSSGGIISAVYAGSALYHLGYAGATSPITIMNYGSQSNIPVGFLTNNTERMRITSSGNVGIGTTSPAATLDVNGSLSISSMANYRSYSFSGNISSNTWYEVANRSNLSSGVWVVLVYLDTWAAGGNVYDVMYASVPFYYNNVYCNETSGLSYTLPTLYGSGHAINSNTAPSVRIRATPSATAQIYIEVNIGSITLTGLDGITAGKKIFVYFRKIA